MIYIADTHTLFETPIVDAFGPVAPKFRHFPLGPGLVGALAASGPADIWIGTYLTDSPGRIFRFPVAAIAGLHDGETLTQDKATRNLPIPSYGQGAALDPDGKRLWVAQSDFYWGRLTAIEIASGSTVLSYDGPPGVEGIDFDSAGRFWGVSEAGVRHNYDLPMVNLFTPFFPLLFQLHVADLHPR